MRPVVLRHLTGTAETGSLTRPRSDSPGGGRLRPATSWTRQGHGRAIPSPAGRCQTRKCGALLAVPATGAYCFTMSNNYNGNRRIPVVFAGNGQARLVVRRETWAELSARDLD